MHILKDTLCRTHRAHSIQRLVIIKEISTKMYFHSFHKISVPFSTIYTQHTYFIFGSNLVPSAKSLNTKLEIFSFNLYSPGAQDKGFKLLLHTDIQTDVQMQIIIFPCPLLILNTPYSKNSVIITRHADKLRTSI